MEIERMYYMQDARKYVGNSILWWAKGKNGYTTQINNAHQFTEQEVNKKNWRSTDIAWDRDYIHEKVSAHVDAQHVDKKESGIKQIKTQSK